MAKTRIPYPHCRWTEKAFLEEKSRIKQELDQISNRLSYALMQTGKLENEFSARGQLRRYIFIVSALVAHGRDGGLTNGQVRRLESLALAILKTQGVRPQQSRLAGLYGDLDLVVSQIQRKAGAHWDSLWLQQTATLFPDKVTPHEDLALAIRAQRQGFLSTSLKSYEQAVEKGLEGENLFRAHWGKITSLRLSGKLSEARMAVMVALQLPELSDEDRAELEWQRKCVQAQETGDPTMLVAGVSRGKVHYSVEYRVEAALWAYAISSKALVERLPLLRSLPRIHHASMRDNRLYTVALSIENCYDSTIPLALRARKAGTTVEKAKKLLHLDHELLALVATARWLARAHLFTLADYCLQLYRRHSLNLTDQRTSDVLNIAGDLETKPWREKVAA